MRRRRPEGRRTGLTTAVTVALLGRAAQVTGDASVNLQAWRGLGGALIELEGEGSVRARLDAADDTITFIIEDDGVGLPARDRDRLTEPYVTTREKGTGLGLAIVKRICEEHGGELKLADAEQLSGARVCLVFPLKSSLQAAVAGGRDAKASRSPTVPAGE